MGCRLRWLFYLFLFLLRNLFLFCFLFSYLFRRSLILWLSINYFYSFLLNFLYWYEFFLKCKIRVMCFLFLFLFFLSIHTILYLNKFIFPLNSINFWILELRLKLELFLIFQTIFKRVNQYKFFFIELSFLIQNIPIFWKKSYLICL